MFRWQTSTAMSRTELKKAWEMGSRKWFMYFSRGEYKNYPDGKTDNTTSSL